MKKITIESINYLHSKIQVIDILNDLKSKKLIKYDVNNSSDLISRGAEELIITFLTSSALTIFAKCILNLTKRKSVYLKIQRNDGTIIEANSKGSNLREIERIIKHLNISTNNSNQTNSEFKTNSIKLSIEKREKNN